MEEEEENKNDAYQGSQIIYEDNKIIFLKCNSFDSAKYFGPTFLSKYYNRYTGDVYIIVDKEGGDIIPTLSYVIHKPIRNEIEYYDYDHNDLTISDILEKFPEIEDKIYDLTGTSDTYGALKKILGGQEIDVYRLRDVDDLISGFRFNGNNPGKSMITIRFDSYEEYFSLFDFDDDEINYLTSVFSLNHNFFGNRGHSDWSEGYLMREFNNENLEMVKEILSFIKPEIASLKTEVEMNIASELFMELFTRETESIIDEYTSEMDSCMQRSEISDVENDLADVFQSYRIFNKDGAFGSYVTTVNSLLSLYDLTKERRLDLHGVLTKIGHTMSVGPYQENSYETDCHDFDSESFDKWTNYSLNQILEKIEDSGEYPNLNEFRKIVDEVLSKYELSTYYSISRRKKVNEGFIITKIDPKTNKLHIKYSSFKNGERVFENRSYTLDEFKTFLHNAELFENKILKSQKKV